MLIWFKKGPLRGARLRSAGGGGFDAGPARDEFVISAGVFGLAEAFAESVEAVGELAHGFGFAAEGREEHAGCRFAALFKRTDELMKRFPHRGARVGTWVPVARIISPSEQSDFS